MKAIVRFVVTLALLAFLASGAALAQTIRLGAVVSATGSASALGQPEANTLRMLEDQLNAAGGIAGMPVEITVLDDATETSQAVVNVRRLIEQEKVHAVICCTTSPVSLAILDTVQSAGVPNISLAAAVSIIEPVAERHWVFKTPQTDRLMIAGIVKNMQAKGIRTAAFVGLDDAYGEGGLHEFQQAASTAGIDIIDTERYGRNDTDVTPQALKVATRNPDAVLVWGVVRDSALVVDALVGQGYNGQIYVSHGVGNPEFLQLGGDAVNGVLLPIGPLLVADQLPDSNPLKRVDQAYAEAYDRQFGAGTASTFGGHAYDAVHLLKLAIEDAVAKGADMNDLPAARAAIRDSLEAIGPFTGVGGVFDFTPEDHLGLDERALVIVQVQNGDWQLVE
ncbi:MAG TPA: ABC transporter substrate-binding protein [Trueperaceae bacterium]